MGQLAIIADDLSSCTDCGIQIAREGLKTFVPLGPGQDFAQLAAYDVVAIDTDSRAIPAQEAYQRAYEAACLVRPYFRSYYKSIDSTLRGNLGAEIDGVMDAIEFDLAVVAPAYPFYKRTSLGGTHYLRGQPIHLTEFGSDPQCPVREADLMKLFGGQSRRKVGRIVLETLRRGRAATSAKIEDMHREGAELIVFDACYEPDLSRIIKSASACSLRVLWVGSTGLAGHLAPILSLDRVEMDEHPASDRSAGLGLTLTVAGSASEVTRLQLAEAAASGGFTPVYLEPTSVIREPRAREAEVERCCARLVEELAAGQDAILKVHSERADIAATQDFGAQFGLDSGQVSTRIVDCLAEITLVMVERFPLSGLILTGGDTAKAVCSSLGARGIEVLDEVEPGIPLARLVGDHEILIVTKAGGFGQPDTLLRSIDAIKRRWKHT